MARPWRVQFPEAVYHVMARGNNRSAIFHDDHDRGEFLDLLGQAAERFQVRVLAFCLMGNHYHLFLRTPQANLSSAMHWLNATYTARFNRRRRRVGHLFQGRFKAVLVTREAHWINLSVYLHLNPVRSGRVEAPEEYEWSSCRDYLQPPRFTWLAAGDVLALYGKSEASARRRYRAEISRLAGQEAGGWDDFWKEFTRDTAAALARLSDQHPPDGDRRTVPEYRRTAEKKPDGDAALAQVAAVFDVATGELQHHQRNFLARKAAAYHLVERAGLSVKDAAALLNVSSPAVSAALKSFRARLTADPSLRKKMEALSY